MGNNKRYYFRGKERQKELGLVISSWLGTPYRHWSGVKGEGCDCIHFVVRVLEEVGLGSIKIPRYPKDWHLHSTQELLLDGVRSNLDVVSIDIDETPMNGDIIMYRFGKTISHSGIYFEDYVYQSVDGSGVERRVWKDDQWFDRREYILRIVE